MQFPAHPTGRAIARDGRTTGYGSATGDSDKNRSGEARAPVF